MFDLTTITYVAYSILGLLIIFFAIYVLNCITGDKKKREEDIEFFRAWSVSILSTLLAIQKENTENFNKIILDKERNDTNDRDKSEVKKDCNLKY